MLNYLPYAVEELPLVISMVPGEHSEMYGFYGERSPNARLQKFLRKSFGVHYAKISVDQFKKNFESKQDRTKVYLIGQSSAPTMYLYLSYYYQNYYEFFVTEFGKRKEIEKMLDLKEVTFVVSPNKDIDTPARLFNGNQKKGDMFAIQNYVNFLNIPSLNRYSFQDFCESTQIGKVTKLDSLPIVCILAIENSKDYQKVQNLFK